MRFIATSSRHQCVQFGKNAVFKRGAFAMRQTVFVVVIITI